MMFTTQKNKMNLLFTAGDKELLHLRNKLFVEKCIPELLMQGFEQSPFTSYWFGRDHNGNFNYFFCRLKEESILQNIEVQIVKGDKWIKLFLNIFKLYPLVRNLKQLHGNDGLKFLLPPNSLYEMRLPYYNNPPFLQYRFWFKQHKIGFYCTKSGLVRNIDRMGEVICSDIMNIDFQIKKWNRIFKPNFVDWDGNRLE